MYAFIDRPVASLSAGEAFLLSVVRAWTASYHQRRCPVSMLMGSFARVGARHALRHFNMAMMMLAGDSRPDAAEMLGIETDDGFGRSVGEREAVLLTVARDLASDRTANATATLGLLVSEEMATPALRAFSLTVAYLTEAGIDLRASSDGRQEIRR